MTYELLNAPLSMDEMRRQADAGPDARPADERMRHEPHGYAVGVVTVDLSDFIDNDLEGILDLLSERLTGGPLLMDIAYKVVGHDGDALHIEVSGDVFEVVLDDDERDRDND